MLCSVFNAPGGLNSQLQQCTFEGKKIDTVVDMLLHSKLKSTIDARSCYLQIPVPDPQDRRNMAVHYNGVTTVTYEAVVIMMFGVSDAVAFAVKTLNEHILDPILQKEGCKTACIVDDISFGSDGDDECYRQFCDIFDRFDHHVVYVSMEKMRCGFTEIDTLGYKISGDCLAISDKRLVTRAPEFAVS